MDLPTDPLTGKNHTQFRANRGPSREFRTMTFLVKGSATQRQLIGLISNPDCSAWLGRQVLGDLHDVNSCRLRVAIYLYFHENWIVEPACVSAAHQIPLAVPELRLQDAQHVKMVNPRPT